MKKMREVREVGRRRVFDGFFGVDEIEIETDGQPGTQRRLSVERGDAVGVVIFDPERGEMLFVRQVRAPLLRHGEAWLTEIVAGVVDPGETPEKAAARETEEETGFHPQALREIGSIYGSPGGLSERVWLFYSEISHEDRIGDGGGIEDEQVEPVWLTPREAYRRLDAGEFRDAKTQVALYRLRDTFRDR